MFGQFPVDAGGQGDTSGLLFTKDTRWSTVQTLALAALTASGELTTITETWMADSQAPMPR